MTKMEKKHCKALLETLHEREGRAMNEEDLFGECHTRTECSLREFKSALAICDARGWLTGVEGKFSGRLWDINDEGEVARLQL